MNAILGLAMAGVLTLGFAAVGEAVLGRSSRDLAGWNASFLMGVGICAAALFPLSLALPGYALAAEFGAMILSALVLSVHRLRRASSAHEPHAAGELAAIGRDRVARILLVAVLAVAAFFGALNLWSANGWDSVQVWGTKAQKLFYEGGLTRRWFLEDPYDSRILSYPPMISLFEALLSRLRGAFDIDRVKSIFPFFYMSLLIGTFSAARTVCSRRWSLAAVLLVALLPELTTGASAGGYVDMPLAAFVAAAVAASLGPDETRRGWRSPLPWLLGGMTTVKQEGMILALAACGTIAVSWMIERPRRVRPHVREALPGAVVILAFIVARIGYVRWIGVHDATWGPLDGEHITRAMHSIRLVVSTCLGILIDPGIWGLFWPAFFASAILMVLWRRPRLALLALAVTATILIDAAIFFMTNWDIAVHIHGAYTRLLAQIAPSAAVVIVAAAEPIWSPTSVQNRRAA
jgi:hypothetical protein